MANSARDPYWHAAVRREVLDHPDRAGGDRGQVLDLPHADGALRFSGGRRPAARYLRISRRRRRSTRSRRTACRARFAIRSRPTDSASTRASTAVSRSTRTAVRPVVSAARDRRGPPTVMRSAAGFTPSAATHIQRSELCATCHTLFTTALDDAGNAIGDAAGAGAVSGVAAQRLPRHDELSELPHAEVAVETPISLGARPAAAARLAAHVPRRQRLHAAASSTGIARARRHGAAAGARRRSRRDASGTSARRRRRSTIAAAAASGSRLDSSSHCEHDGPQAADGLPVAARLAACRRHGARGAVVFESGAMRRTAASSATTTTPTARVRAALRRDHERRAGADLRVDHGRCARRGDDGIAARRALREGQPAAAARLRQGDAPADIAVQGAAAADTSFVAGADRVRYRIALAPRARGPLTVDGGAALPVDRLSLGRESARLPRAGDRAVHALLRGGRGRLCDARRTRHGGRA